MSQLGLGAIQLGFPPKTASSSPQLRPPRRSHRRRSLSFFPCQSPHHRHNCSLSIASHTATSATSSFPPPEYYSEFTYLLCHCGQRTVIRTAKTKANHGRKFHGCYAGKAGCNFFEWAEPDPSLKEFKLVDKLLDRNVQLVDEKLRLVDFIKQQTVDIEKLKAEKMVLAFELDK